LTSDGGAATNGMGLLDMVVMEEVLVMLAECLHLSAMELLIHQVMLELKVVMVKLL